MDVSIQERIFSFRSEYDISTPNAKYYARKLLFSFNDKLQIQAEDGRVLARIQGYFSPLRSRHDFILSDGRIFRFRCERIWKRVFLCEGTGEIYRLYEHNNYRYSIFHGDNQIAAFVKNRIVFGKGNRYEIRMDSDADLMVVLCLVLTINTSENENNNSDMQNFVTIEFSIGPQARKFDESWEPR